MKKHKMIAFSSVILIACLLFLMMNVAMSCARPKTSSQDALEVDEREKDLSMQWEEELESLKEEDIMEKEEVYMQAPEETTETMAEETTETMAQETTETMVQETTETMAQETVSTQEEPYLSDFDIEINIPENIAWVFVKKDWFPTKLRVIGDAEKEGLISLKSNGDGSITYTMPESIYHQLIIEMENEVLWWIENNENKEGSAIKDIIYDKKFSEMVFMVDRIQYNNEDKAGPNLVIRSLGIYALNYQIFDNYDTGDYKVAVSAEDTATNKTFITMNLPDDIEE